MSVSSLMYPTSNTLEQVCIDVYRYFANYGLMADYVNTGIALAKLNTPLPRVFDDCRSFLKKCVGGVCAPLDTCVMFMDGARVDVEFAMKENAMLSREVQLPRELNFQLALYGAGAFVWDNNVYACKGSYLKSQKPISEVGYVFCHMGLCYYVGIDPVHQYTDVKTLVQAYGTFDYAYLTCSAGSFFVPFVLTGELTAKEGKWYNGENEVGKTFTENGNFVCKFFWRSATSFVVIPMRPSENEFLIPFLVSRNIMEVLCENVRTTVAQVKGQEFLGDEVVEVDSKTATFVMVAPGTVIKHASLMHHSGPCRYALDTCSRFVPVHKGGVLLDGVGGALTVVKRFSTVFEAECDTLCIPHGSMDCAGQHCSKTQLTRIMYTLHLTTSRGEVDIELCPKVRSLTCLKTERNYDADQFIHSLQLHKKAVDGDNTRQTLDTLDHKMRVQSQKMLWHLVCYGKHRSWQPRPESPGLLQLWTLAKSGVSVEQLRRWGHLISDEQYDDFDGVDDQQYYLVEQYVFWIMYHVKMQSVSDTTSFAAYIRSVTDVRGV